MVNSLSNPNPNCLAFEQAQDDAKGTAPITFNEAFKMSGLSEDYRDEASVIGNFSFSAL